MSSVVSLLLTALLLRPPSASPQQSVQVPPVSPPASPTLQDPALPILIVPLVPVPETYVIGKQDQLKITVFEDESLNNVYTVDADGTITLPYISRLPAAGLTQRQL